MTADVGTYRCDEAHARQITEEIRANVEKVHQLLIRSYEWQAYRALGYPSWRDYAMTEFGISKSRAYELLDQARVIRAIEGAAPDVVSGMPEINARQADALAPIVRKQGPGAAADVLRAVAEAGPVTAKAIKEEASNRAKVTTTTRTTEATKVEQIVDLDTGEVLNEDVTAEQWQADGNDPVAPVADPVAQLLANDPDVRAANLRHGLSRWMYHLSQYHLYDPAEIATIAPDLAEDIAKLVGHVADWGDRYASAHRRARMTVVRGS